MQLFQIAVDASIRATGGQHHVDTALARRGNGGFHRWRDGMVGSSSVPSISIAISLIAIGSPGKMSLPHANAIPLKKQ
jgi:hypothetical protein